MAVQRMTREKYVQECLPSQKIKVAAKNSDAVAYLYLNDDAMPCAAVFRGRCAKPCWRYRFPDQAKREDKVKKYFEEQSQKAQQKTESEKRKLEIGHVLKSSWGYDQTNVDWYIVTALIGKTMAEIQKIGSTDASDGSEAWATGKSIPNKEQKIGKPFRRKVSGASVKIDSVAYAHLWNGRPAAWTAYA